MLFEPDAPLSRLFAVIGDNDDNGFVALDIGHSRLELTQAIWDTFAANDMTTDVHVRLMVTRRRKKKPCQHPRLGVYGTTIIIIAEYSKPYDRAFVRGIRLMTVPYHRGLPLTQDA